MKLGELSENDRLYLHYTWLTSLRKTYACLPDQVYRETISAAIWTNLERSELAVHHAENGLIVGWAAVEEPDILHYVFVKSLYRQMGVAKNLLAQWHISCYTCYTEWWPPVAAKLVPGATFAPWKFRR